MEVTPDKFVWLFLVVTIVGWQDALRHMRRIPGIAGHLTNVGASGVINDVIRRVLECPEKDSLDTILPYVVGRKTVKKQMGMLHSTS